MTNLDATRVPGILKTLPESVRPVKAHCLAAGLALLFAVFWAAPAATQSDAPLPDWLVPVIQLVADDRGIPGTGIFLGEERVLVPVEMTSNDSRLIVLDGGADLSRNGKVATVMETFRLQGLAILHVPGLLRSVPTLAAETSGIAGDRTGELALMAYAPPELLALGQGTVTARSGRHGGIDAWQVDAERPLPNVTGALVDACGNLMGHSAARGMASMSRSTGAQVRWRNTLDGIFATAGVQLPQAECDEDWPEVRPDPPQVAQVPRPEPETESVPEPPVESSASTSPPVVDPKPEVQEDPALDDRPPAWLLNLPLEITAAEEAIASNELSQDDETQTGLDADEGSAWFDIWLWLAFGALTTFAVLALGFVLGRRASVRKSLAGGDSHQPGQRPGGWETAVAVTVGTLRNGRTSHEIRAYEGRVNVTVGRFDTDVLLSSSSVSRRHARISGEQDQLRIEDLGSSNGSQINGVLLKKGEALPLIDGDKLTLGHEDWTFHRADRAVKE